MKLVSELKILVIDHGLFPHVARRMARDAKLVWYWTPTERAFPTVQDLYGDGFPDIVRPRSIEQVKADCDLIVFPDIGFADLQVELAGEGFPVWGARHGDRLERMRGEFLDTLRDKTSLPVPPHERVRGITALCDHLLDLEDKYVKISHFRGDMETFHWRSWAEDRDELRRLELRFGPFKETILFYVFDPIKTDIEDGIDTNSVDGQIPALVFHGMEKKDCGLIGTMQKFSDVPKELRLVNEQFAPIHKDLGYRGPFSSEVRIKDGKSYFTDSTNRYASPPSQAMMEITGNFTEMVARGAAGQCVDPEATAKFAVQAAVRLKGAGQDWAAMKVHPELDRWLKCGFCVREGDMLWISPVPQMGDLVGYLCATGDSIVEAVDALRERNELLPDHASCDIDAMTDLVSKISKAEDKGMEFTAEPVPEPAELVES